MCGGSMSGGFGNSGYQQQRPPSPWGGGFGSWGGNPYGGNSMMGGGWNSDYGNPWQRPQQSMPYQSKPMYMQNGAYNPGSGGNPQDINYGLGPAQPQMPPPPDGGSGNPPGPGLGGGGQEQRYPDAAPQAPQPPPADPTKSATPPAQPQNQPFDSSNPWARFMTPSAPTTTPYTPPQRPAQPTTMQPGQVGWNWGQGTNFGVNGGPGGNWGWQPQMGTEALQYMNMMGYGSGQGGAPWLGKVDPNNMLASYGQLSGTPFNANGPWYGPR